MVLSSLAMPWEKQAESIIYHQNLVGIDNLAHERLSRETQRQVGCSRQLQDLQAKWDLQASCPLVFQRIKRHSAKAQIQFSSAQSLSDVRLFVTPTTAAHQASLCIHNSWSLLKLMSFESVMPSNHLLCCPLLLLPSIFTSIRVFSNESVLCIRWPKY